MNPPVQTLVIVGSGLAAWTVAREFRKLDKGVPVTLVTQDSGDFYSKPMLSNALCNAKTAAQLVNTPCAAMAASLDVQVMAHTEVHAIDPVAHRLETSSGPVAYGRLVLALGAQPVRLPLQGDAAHRVLSVNDLQDYAKFREALEGARRVAILGAGLIGCEFANDLVNSGYEVDVIEPGTQPLGRLLPPEGACLVEESLRQAGVRFHFGTTVKSIQATVGGVEVELDNDHRFGSDVVLSAVGLSPRVALAKAAGLRTARGIVVNQQLQASHPDIYALGDVAEVQGQWLPYVMPLMQSARTLAAHLSGQSVSLHYPCMPVVVKTPAIPIVVSPPNSGASGQWHIDAGIDSVAARFVGDEGALLGFALVGKATALKMAWQKEVSAS